MAFLHLSGEQIALLIGGAALLLKLAFVLRAAFWRKADDADDWQEPWDA